jgi:hypothetical protein
MARLLLVVPVTVLTVLALDRLGRGTLAAILIFLAFLILQVLATSKIFGPEFIGRLGLKPPTMDPRTIDVTAFWQLYLAGALLLATYSLMTLLSSATDSREALVPVALGIAGATFLLVPLWAYHQSTTQLSRFRGRALRLGRQALAADSTRAAEVLWLEAEEQARWARIDPPTREMIAYLLESPAGDDEPRR